MGVFGGPKIETDGLLFSLDAKNPKTYGDVPGFTDHGISDWYCFRNGTVTYSAIYPNTEILEIDENGIETVMITTGSDPERGTFTVTAGRRYYGTKAIHLLVESGTVDQDKIAPVSFAGTYFANYHSRNEPQRVKIYAPQDDITVNVYQAYKNSGGVTGTATSTFTISRGEDYEHQYIGEFEITLGTGSGDYQVGETVNYEWVNATNKSNITPVTATVVSWNSSTKKLTFDNVDPGNRFGTEKKNFFYDTGQTIGVAFTGATSGAEYTYANGARNYNTWTFFETDKPAIMTVNGGNAADAMIMQPAARYSYRRSRRNYGHRTINDTTPSNNNTNEYVVYDTSLPVISIEIGDGLGGDATQGIGYEYLSDTYSWGNVLSDYQIVAPYADTTVTVSYWANGQWNVGEVHSLSGTQTEPVGAFREGDTGFGSDGNIDRDDGKAANLASGATLWKWESTKPISVIINDSRDDEERLLGWMSNNYLRNSSNVTQSFVNLIDKDDRSRTKIYGKDMTTTSEYAGSKLSSAEYIEFDGLDDAIYISDNFNDPQRFSVEAWVYPTELDIDANNNYRKLINAYGASPTSLFVVIEESGHVRVRVPGSSDTAGLNYGAFSGANEWGHIVCTYDQSTLSGYFNGELINTKSDSSATVDFGSRLLIAVPGESSGPNTFKGRLAGVRIYNQALTASEVKQNFNAHRRRFGI